MYKITYHSCHNYLQTITNIYKCLKTVYNHTI